MSSPKAKQAARFKKKEMGFDLSSVPHAKLNEYNALLDPNMRHFFENKSVQNILYNTGQIDVHGRIINLDRNKSKLHILEREFEEAEKVEERRMKEELEMRYRVQRKRFSELERTRREEILMKTKADKELSKEIIATVKNPPLSKSMMSGSSRKLRSNNSLGNSGFFVTEADDSGF